MPSKRGVRLEARGDSMPGDHKIRDHYYDSRYSVNRPTSRDDLQINRAAVEELVSVMSARWAKQEAALRKKIGEPKFKVGDKVRFASDGVMDNAANDGHEFTEAYGVVAIVDATGTFEQHEEPSYDLWFHQKDGTELLWKHIRQSELEAATDAGVVE